MKRNFTICGLVLIVVGSLLQISFHKQIIIPAAAIEFDSGHGYYFNIRNQGFFHVMTDSITRPLYSPTRLFENQNELKLAHSVHDDICKIGLGRFSHWKKGRLYFSASDNSDPRKNDKQYMAVVRFILFNPLRCTGLAAIIMAVFIFIFILIRTRTVIEFYAKAQLILKSEPHPMALILLYLFILVGIHFGVSFLLYQSRSQSLFSRSVYGSVINKQIEYATDPERFDAVFVGDSRTYTDIQPFIIDRCLKIHTLNLAGFTNWFPTQYAHYRDMVSVVPSRQFVIWSLGHQNFSKGGTIQNQYPIGLKNAAYYLTMGFKSSELFGNIIFFNPLTQLIDQSKALRSRFDRFTSNVIWQSSKINSSPGSELTVSANSELKSSAAAQHYLNDPAISTDALSSFNTGSDGIINSLALQTKQGSYLLVELNSDYFRKKQQSLIAGRSAQNDVQPVDIDPVYWKLFIASLELYRRQHIRLIVNEVEEAPFIYSSAAQHEEYRKFMREKVQPEVEKRGAIYVRADWNSFDDSDYFDYNHLNSKGAQKYSAMLSELLQPHLKAG